jgi:hypothetical protein
MAKFLSIILITFFTHQVIAQKPCECAFKKKAPKDTPFHLYSPETEIVVLSYKNVYDTTEIIKPDGTFEVADIWLKDVGIEVKDNKHIIPAIQDSIILKTSQKEQLFKILHLYQVVRGNSTTNYNCYQPHHLILFYQSKQIVAFLEVCFLCYGSSATEGILENLFSCSKKYDLLKDFFKEIGIKHHLEDE